MCVPVSQFCVSPFLSFPFLSFSRSFLVPRFSSLPLHQNPGLRSARWGSRNSPGAINFHRYRGWTNDIETALKHTKLNMPHPSQINSWLASIAFSKCGWHRSLRVESRAHLKIHRRFCKSTSPRPTASGVNDSGPSSTIFQSLPRKPNRNFFTLNPSSAS